MHAQAPSCRQCLTLSMSPMSLGTKGRQHTIGRTVHLRSGRSLKTQGQHCASCTAKTALSSLPCASPRPRQNRPLGIGNLPMQLDVSFSSFPVILFPSYNSTSRSDSSSPWGINTVIPYTSVFKF